MNLSSFYMGAPCSPQNLQFYTAPSSPMQSDVCSSSKDDEFEFEITTRTFSNRCEFQQKYPAFWWTKRNGKEEENYRLPARAQSFCSGQVLPLKPPPQIHASVTSSPRSPNSLLKLPFSRPCAWNDDFDPFQFALEKVSDETRARMSFHRRSHSYSAYRTSGVAHLLDGSTDRNKGGDKQGFKPKSNMSKIFEQGYGHGSSRMKPNEHLKPRGPTVTKMLERKDSVYSRRVISTEATSNPRSKLNPMARTKTNGPWLERRMKAVYHEPMKITSNVKRLYEEALCIMDHTFKLM
ncbi:hypothetical protein Tco_0683357, partial [Tanacetum coccineum]